MGREGQFLAAEKCLPKSSVKEGGGGELGTEWMERVAEGGGNGVGFVSCFEMLTVRLPR